jgi:hypothetical protein
MNLIVPAHPVANKWPMLIRRHGFSIGNRKSFLRPAHLLLKANSYKNFLKTGHMHFLPGVCAMPPLQRFQFLFRFFAIFLEKGLATFDTRCWIACAAVTLLGGCDQKAFADCRWYNGGSARSLSMAMPSSVRVSPSARVGDILWQNTITGNSTSLYCSPGGFYHTTGWSTPQTASNLNRVYNTSLPGVGMQIQYNNDTPMQWPRNSQYFSGQFWFFPLNRWNFRFIKTADINSGLATIPTQGATFTYGSLIPLTFTLTNNNVQFIVDRPTCSLSNRASSVNFGVVPIRATNGLIMERNFDVSVRCVGGAAGATTPVRITFTDANNTFNRGNNLTVNPTNGGMAINLLRNFNPIYFGPPSSAANNPGQILLGNANAGAYNFPITARLMRTGPMRALPAFAAAATMTMRYE